MIVAFWLGLLAGRRSVEEAMRVLTALDFVGHGRMRD